MAMPNDFLARSMPPSSATVETMWEFLEQGIDYIMSNARSGIMYPNYMELSTTVYNVCTSSRLNGPASPGTQHSECMHALHSSTRPIMTVAEKADQTRSILYSNLIQYFVTHLSDLKEVRRGCISKRSGRLISRTAS